MVALSLWKVVCCRDFCYSIGWQPCHYGKEVCCSDLCYYNRLQPCHYERQSFVENFVTPMDGSLYYGWQSIFGIFGTPMDGSLVIMEGSLLSRFLLQQWMVALSLFQVVCCRDFCYSKGWQPCHCGKQFIVEIFFIPMDGSLAIMKGSLLSRSVLL